MSAWSPPKRRRRAALVPAALFLATALSTLWVGALQGIQFDAAEPLEVFPWPASFAETIGFLGHGVPFAVTILGILLAHEMGHYLTARYYRVDTTLPYFIPFPFSLVGTMGAFILIRSPFPNRKALLDIGLAGPFAGFLVTLPALVLGIASSRLGPALADGGGLRLGEPLLFRWVSELVWPGAGAGETLYVSPVGFAAWFGLFATAINLLPIGQLDGGHATYALFRRGAHRISRLAFFLLFPMTYFGPTWLVWALLALVFGIRRPHPPTLDDAAPLPPSRRLAGLLGYATFVLCFTPEPIVFSWHELFAALRELAGA